MFNLKPPQDDGLLIPTVGEWSRDKHYFLKRYIDGFTNSMKDKNWSGLHYIDLFAGAGIERLETSNKLDWGSPLIAAQAQHPFDCLHLCEKDVKLYEALEKRISNFTSDCKVFHGDANDKIHEIVKNIPRRSLSLAFLDPFGLHLDYETLCVLNNIIADLIVFFPDRLDALRNWEHYYFKNPNSNLDRCFGKGADWRSIMNDTLPENRAQILRDLYIKQIEKLGYSEFEYERISAQGRPLYRLIFCSRHEVAAKIWRGILSKKPNGQKTFDFKDTD
ncbi:MAG: three-Cys-motif partner protein TcmP [Planctomycetes bacterium]|nr:three-Cys-motif partner protein TcmP [Planctomycetota bacterium]